MPRRLVLFYLVAAASVVLNGALIGALVTACYDVPKPDCGFACGPGGECPDEYRCASENRCHRIGAPDTLVCNVPDAGVSDAASDAPLDAGVDAEVADAAAMLRP